MKMKKSVTDNLARWPFAASTLAGVSMLAGCCLGPEIYNDGPEFRLKGKTHPYQPSYTFLEYAGTPRSPRLKPDLIIVTLSGGGIRAAALAAATLNELHKFTINGAPITDNIVLVSSTSGGSIAAGYVAVHGFGKYAEFRRDFLTKPNTRDLILRGIGPRLFYDRSSIMREFLEERLDLKGLTFGELVKRDDRPFFVMNATDLSSGEQFSFTQSTFNHICTDLRPMPISVGIAASAAIPFLLTDVELRNRMDECPDYMKTFSQPTFFFGSRDAVVQRYKYHLAHAYDDNAPVKDRPRPKFIHLADGGLVDNLGAGGADDAEIDAASSISDQIEPRRQENRAIRQVLVVEVNARSDKQKPHLDQQTGSPGLLSMLGLSIDIPIDRATSLTDGVLQSGFQAAESMRYYVDQGIFITQIDFDLIGDDEADLRDRVKSIGTTLTLSESQLSELEHVASKLLRSSGCFARYVALSGAEGPAYRLPSEKGITGQPYDCSSLIDLPR